MVPSIVIGVLTGLAFIGVVSYLLYLKVHGRNIDEEDCQFARNRRVLNSFRAQRQRERKASLKKKRELDRLDRLESKKRNKVSRLIRISPVYRQK